MIISKRVYPDMEEKQSDIGVSGLMNDKQFNLVPEGLKRMNRRENSRDQPRACFIEEQT